MNDLNDIPQRLDSIDVMSETHPAMEKVNESLLEKQLI